MSKSKSFFSILLGLAAGTAIGMLYAPDKGWKTRARIRRAAANGYEDLKEDLDNLGTKADEKTAEAFIWVYWQTIIRKWVDFFVLKKSVRCTKVKDRL